MVSAQDEGDNASHRKGPGFLDSVLHSVIRAPSLTALPACTHSQIKPSVFVSLHVMPIKGVFEWLRLVKKVEFFFKKKKSPDFSVNDSTVLICSGVK